MRHLWVGGNLVRTEIRRYLMVGRAWSSRLLKKFTDKCLCPQVITLTVRVAVTLLWGVLFFPQAEAGTLLNGLPTSFIGRSGKNALPQRLAQCRHDAKILDASPANHAGRYFHVLSDRFAQWGIGPETDVSPPLTRVQRCELNRFCDMLHRLAGRQLLDQLFLPQGGVAEVEYRTVVVTAPGLRRNNDTPKSDGYGAESLVSARSPGGACVTPRPV